MFQKMVSKRSVSIAMVQLLLPVLALAEDTGVDKISQPLPAPNLDTVLQNIRNLFFGAVIVACVFMILWAAFNFVTAAGDEKKVSDAKKTITYAIIGLIVAALAATLVSVVRGIVQ
jgi:hypothetical protein